MKEPKLTSLAWPCGLIFVGLKQAGVWYCPELFNTHLLLEKHREGPSSYSKLLTHKQLKLYFHAGSTFAPALPLQAAPYDRSPSCWEEPHPFRHLEKLY